MAMDRCLLCLQTHTEPNSYIPINSKQWVKLNILSIIEKHFWPIDNIKKILGICQLCWSKLNEFHTFFKTIEQTHWRNINISSDVATSRRNFQDEIYQLSTPKIFKNNFKSTDDSNFTIDAIEIEESHNKEELFCIPPPTAIDEKTCMPLSTEKRKRGRPRKKCIVNENLIQTTKGKRGRPRKHILDIHEKINFQNDPCATLSQNTLQSKDQSIHHSQCTLQQGTPITSIIIPPKTKRSRGRPRKIQQKDANAVHDGTTLDNEVFINRKSSTIQEEGDTKDVSLNLNKAEKLRNKKLKFSSLLKKRKRIQQHKALMRNYIATSVRCMKFLRK